MHFEVFQLYILGLQLILLSGANADVQKVKIVQSKQNPNTIQPQYTALSTATDLRNTSSQFSTAVSICVQGMVALYSAVNWAEGRLLDDPKKVSVTILKGYSVAECTRANQVPQLQNVKSLAFLGAPDMTDGLQMFSLPSFLGGSWTVSSASSSPTGFTGFGMGSLAITGGNMWVLCADATCSQWNSVCVDMSLQPGGMFYVENTRMDNSTAWPKVVRAVQIAASLYECLSYINPPPATQSSSGGIIIEQ